MPKQARPKPTPALREAYKEGYNPLYIAPAIHRINLDMLERLFGKLPGWECTGGGDAGAQYLHERLGVELSFITEGDDDVPTHVAVTATRIDKYVRGDHRNPVERCQSIEPTHTEEQVAGYLSWLILTIVDDRLRSVQWLLEYRRALVRSQVAAAVRGDNQENAPNPDSGEPAP